MPPINPDLAIDLTPPPVTEPEEEKATLIEHLEAAIDYVQTARADCTGPIAAREFSIAITALEDAQMRWTRGMAVELHGRVTPHDLEKENQ